MLSSLRSGSGSARSVLRSASRRWVCTAPLLRSSSLASSRSLRSVSASQSSFQCSSRSFSTESAAAYSPQYFAVNSLISAFRTHGHLLATLDPLGIQQPDSLAAHPELNPATYGLAEGDAIAVEGSLAAFFPTSSSVSVSDLVSRLHSVYSSHTAFEFSHCQSAEEREWFANQLEATNSVYNQELTPAERRNFFISMLQSESFDHFMTKKFTAFKRYGIEGNEAALAGLEALFPIASANGVESIVIGMPHRGRLNFLVSSMEFPARALFSKIKGTSLIAGDVQGICDVASHIACSAKKRMGNKELSVSLLHNPSHLEAVNPVACGKVRAKQDELERNGNKKPLSVMAIQIHGDAALVGQGVNAETFAMSSLEGFQVGGTVHMVFNNQLGFTTGAQRYRSTKYSSDFGKSIGMPVVHVNSESPESVLRAVKLAVAYRQRFGRDILLDFIGYRRWGHNEVDEPGFTQPKMYANIRSRASIVAQFEKSLIANGLLTAEGVEKIRTKLNQHLESELKAAADWKPTKEFNGWQGKWKGIRQPSPVEVLDSQSVSTGYPIAELREIAKDSVKLPTGFHVHNRLQRSHIDPRNQVADEKNEDRAVIDWATAEAMAFGSLMRDGFTIRICGQDVDRGTFSQRHSVFVDQTNEKRFTPLLNAHEKRREKYPGAFYSVNSLLSEEAVLGYEFGYNWESPQLCNIWEAQFGDFNNGAQIMIDQFIASSEAKWARSTGLTMLLPHGYDGAGPEHSSARVERFLQITDNVEDVREFPLPAEYKKKFPGLKAIDSECSRYATKNSVNMLVANPSTPSNYFHLLRRQMKRDYRKPLVVISPKLLLRFDRAVSAWKEFSESTRFQPVLFDDSVAANAPGVKTVVFCSGKVYYELEARRAAEKRTDFSIVRLEELSPFPWTVLLDFFHSLGGQQRKFIWFQEESQNAGAWQFVQPRLQSIIDVAGQSSKIEYVGRSPLSCSAVGAGVEHKREVEAIYKALAEKTRV